MEMGMCAIKLQNLKKHNKTDPYVSSTKFQVIWSQTLGYDI